MKEESQEYWNLVANSWERFGDCTGDVEKYVQETLDKYLKRNRNDIVLNLGSGGGDRYLQDKGNNIVHLDYSRNMLIANKTGIKIEADARNSLPFNNESFENITSFFLMRYLTREQQNNLIVESQRVLKSGGVLIIVDVPNNSHQYQVEKFDPKNFAGLLEALNMESLENQIVEREVSKWISTGFGGWHSKGSYLLGTLVARKEQLTN